MAIQTRETETAALGETLTLVHTMAMKDIDAKDAYVSLEVTDNALDQFAIIVKASADDTGQTLYDTASDFTNPLGDLIGSSGDLTTQAVGNGFFRMNVEAYHTIEVWAASGNAAGSGITVRESTQTTI